jgi:hypothetical protein
MPLLLLVAHGQPTCTGEECDHTFPYQPSRRGSLATACVASSRRGAGYLFRRSAKWYQHLVPGHKQRRLKEAESVYPRLHSQIEKATRANRTPAMKRNQASGELQAEISVKRSCFLVFLQVARARGTFLRSAIVHCAVLSDLSKSPKIQFVRPDVCASRHLVTNYPVQS